MTQNDFAELALSYVPDVAAYTRRLSRTEWDADDLLQSAYERAFRSWRQLRERRQCRAWLFRIARNLHRDGARALLGVPWRRPRRCANVAFRMRCRVIPHN